MWCLFLSRFIPLGNCCHCWKDGERDGERVLECPFGLKGNKPTVQQPDSTALQRTSIHLQQLGDRLQVGWCSVLSLFRKQF